MSEYRDVLGFESGLYELCARHTGRYTTRALQHIYLCDSCAPRMAHEIFNDRPPIYHGETIEGYCGLCNEPLRVTLRQWFVCPVCWNVVVAYQKAFVASKWVHARWAADIQAAGFPFSLRETEEVRLSPFARAAKTKKVAATALSDLDFVVAEGTGSECRPLFHIELKSGPGAVDTMREFQLDVNDFNDVVGAVNNTGLPAYIFHVQLGHEYRPPTRRTVAAGMWWTDPVRLRQHLKRVSGRRGEDKQAAYFTPAAFHPWSEFPKELESRNFEKLTAAVRDTPLEPL
jgi:hypothetical protein